MVALVAGVLRLELELDGLQDPLVTPSSVTLRLLEAKRNEAGEVWGCVGRRKQPQGMQLRTGGSLCCRIVGCPRLQVLGPVCFRAVCVSARHSLPDTF